MSKNNQGFRIAALTIVIAVILVACFIAWRVYDTSQNRNVGTNQSDGQANTDPNAGYLVIKEWGVRLKAGSAGDVMYAVHSTEGRDGTVFFSTNSLSKYGEACGTGQASVSPLGKLIRTKGSAGDAPQMSTGYAVQIGEYYYQYVTPQSVCSDDSAAMRIQTESLAAFKESIKTLEEAK